MSLSSDSWSRILARISAPRPSWAAGSTLALSAALGAALLLKVARVLGEDTGLDSLPEEFGQMALDDAVLAPTAGNDALEAMRAAALHGVTEVARLMPVVRSRKPWLLPDLEAARLLFGALYRGASEVMAFNKPGTPPHGPQDELQAAWETVWQATRP
ncbi:MAG: hypothetical protein OWQ57_06630 [Sulfobacillus sp.]|nr:hypothetical protein [Sulfobacillus sp.]